MDKNENKDLKPYESPFTRKTQVELEEGICVAASGQPITNPVKMEVEVDDWKSIENDVTFE